MASASMLNSVWTAGEARLNRVHILNQPVSVPQNMGSALVPSRSATVRNSFSSQFHIPSLSLSRSHSQSSSPSKCIFSGSSNQRPRVVSMSAAVTTDTERANGSMTNCDQSAEATVSRRAALTIPAFVAFAATSLAVREGQDAQAVGGLPEVLDEKKLCDADCETGLTGIATVTTESGLAYKDIVVGKGPSPPIGFQVAADYVAMIPTGKIFDSSLEKGLPYIFRVGSGQVIAGLDEGLQTMKVGGVRRLFIPGPLAFPKGLVSAPGRPRVPPSSPVVFDVSLRYIPGLEDDDEE
eukprot:TRINITY_DN1650_c0_g1_i1.p1 TRINITY_DN1650_c0_g1~~TRINITY_DN1650_c0_g1_i1.p1  ORF type:complete len:295 (-),score=42.31 TRINITY_DN1650_c0_g1_i1:696-1580(-)